MAEENQAPEIIARKIIREGGKASLATLNRDDKSPYASLVYLCVLRRCLASDVALGFG